jgi:hypothetical protein
MWRVSIWIMIVLLRVAGDETVILRLTINLFDVFQQQPNGRSKLVYVPWQSNISHSGTCKVYYTHAPVFTIKEQRIDILPMGAVVVKANAHVAVPLSTPDTAGCCDSVSTDLATFISSSLCTLSQTRGQRAIPLPLTF